MKKILGKFFCSFASLLCMDPFNEILAIQTFESHPDNSNAAKHNKIEINDELFMKVFGKKRTYTSAVMHYKLSIDGEDVGTVFAFISDKEKKIAASDLKKFLPEFLEDHHVDRIHSKKDSDGFISFSELEKLGCEVDVQLNQMCIDITMPKTLKKERRLKENSRNRDFSGRCLPPATYSGCLTTRFSETFNSQQNSSKSRTKNLLLMPNINIAGLNFEGQISAQQTSGQQIYDTSIDSSLQQTRNNKTKFYRDYSSVIYDMRDKKMRITGGDVISVTSDYQSVPRVFGLGFNKYRRKDHSSTSREIPLTILRKSQVRIYINGALVREKTMFPGSYIFDDLPMTYGSNDVRIEIIDDTGKREELTADHFRDDTVLGFKETEYGITCGSPETNNQDGSRYSKNKVLCSFLKYGIYKSTEAMVGFQRNDIGNLKNCGLKYSTFLGIVEGYYARSTQKNSLTKLKGDAKKISFTTNSIRFLDMSVNGRVTVEKVNKFFTPYIESGNSFVNRVDILNNSYQNIYNTGSCGRTSVTYNFGISFKGVNINFSQRRDKFSNGQKLITQNIYAYKSFDINREGFVQSVNLMLTAGKSRGMMKDNSMGVSMVINLNHGYSVTTSLDRNNGITTKSAGVRKDNNKYGFGFDANVSQNADTKNTRGSIRYDNSRFQTSIDNYSSKSSYGSNNSTTAGFESSLYFADGTFAVHGEPLDSNGFLLAHPTKALGGQKIKLKGQNSESGIFGGAVAIIPYDHENAVDVDMSTLPPGYDIDPSVIHTKGEYKRGTLAKIKGGGQYTAIGNLVYMNSKPIKLASGHVMHMDDKDADRIPFFTNSNGKFYISGLKEGKYKAFLNLEGNHDFYIEVDRKKLSEYGEINIGSIECGEEPTDDN